MLVEPNTMPGSLDLVSNTAFAVPPRSTGSAAADEGPVRSSVQAATGQKQKQAGERAKRNDMRVHMHDFPSVRGVGFQDCGGSDLRSLEVPNQIGSP